MRAQWRVYMGKGVRLGGSAGGGQIDGLGGGVKKKNKSPCLISKVSALHHRSPWLVVILDGSICNIWDFFGGLDDVKTPNNNRGMTYQTDRKELSDISMNTR